MTQTGPGTGPGPLRTEGKITMPITNSRADDAQGALHDIRETGETMSEIARRASTGLAEAHQLRGDEPTSLTPDGQRRVREERRQQVRDRAAADLDRVERQLTRAEETITSAADGAGGRSADDTAAEMAEGRAWDRLRPFLDAGRAPHAVIGRAVDAAEVRALQRELLPYLDARSLQARPAGMSGVGHTAPDRTRLQDAMDQRLAELVGAADGRALRVRVESRSALTAARARLDGVRAQYVRGRQGAHLAAALASQGLERAGRSGSPEPAA